MAVVWDYENAAHLLRRAAFGGTPEQIQAFHDSYASVDEAVDDLLSFATSTKRPPGGGRDFYRATIKQRQWWLKTMLKATNPKDALREKLTLFWHGHLCSGYSKQPIASYMAIQNGLFRRYAKGNFRDLVRDFNRDPANLYYLDGRYNYASDGEGHVAANENFAREVLELFTVGISQLAADGTNDPLKPNYTESDVHQLARICTGWVGDIDKTVGVFEEWAWDGGQYDDDGDDLPDDVTFFGVTNNDLKIGADVAGTPDDVLELIFNKTDDLGNPQAAMYLCRKLWTYFAYPAPAPGMRTLIAGFAAILDGADYDVATVLAAMFKSDEFYSDTAKSRTIKNPVDYVVGTMRMLGLKSNGKTLGDSNELIDMIGEMGMYLFEPPNVAGWPGGSRWITTGTLVSRLDFARRVAELDYSGSALHLETVVTMGSDAADPETVLDEIIARCALDGSQGGVALTANQKAALLFFLTDQGTLSSLDLSGDGSNDAQEAERLVRGTIALVLQSAEAMVF